MSDAPYEKQCMYCQQTITMSKETGKWLPYNKNSSAHDCRKKQKQVTITQDQPDRHARIAAVIRMVQTVVKELEDLK